MAASQGDTPIDNSIEPFSLTEWKRHLRECIDERERFLKRQVDSQGRPVPISAIQRECRARALRLIRDTSMDSLWKRLASQANDTKPFPRGSLRPPDWKRCLVEFAEALIYGYAQKPLAQQAELDDVVFGLKQLLHKVRANPGAATLGGRLLTERADERPMGDFVMDERGRLRPAPQRHRHALLLNETALAHAIDVLSASKITDKWPGGPKPSFKGKQRERNAIVFYLAHSVIPQWFEDSHPTAIARGLKITRPEFDEISADAVRKLSPTSPAPGGN